jgi:hypothetical protein
MTHKRRAVVGKFPGTQPTRSWTLLPGSIAGGKGIYRELSLRGLLARPRFDLLDYCGHPRLIPKMEFLQI